MPNSSAPTTPTAPREIGAADLARVFQAMPGAAAVFAADADFTVLAASDALLATAGRPREALVGRPLAEAFPNASPTDPDAHGLDGLRASIAAAVRTGVPQRMDRQRYDLQRPDGTWEPRYWDAVNVPVREPQAGPDGAVRYVLHQTVDVTAQVVGEAAAVRAAQAERSAAGILECMNDAHCVLDRTFHIVGVNAAAERLLGVPRAALVGRSHWEAFPASVDAPVGRALRRVVAEGVEQHLTHHYTGEGYDLHLEVDAYPTEDGGVAMFWRDVTERVRAVAALRESERRFRTMADAVPQIVWLTDPEGRVEFFNAQWTAYTGAPYEPTTAAAVAASFVHPDDGAATIAAFEEARRTGGMFAVEHRIRSAAGEYRWFLVRAQPFRDPHTGEIVRWFGVSVDIHDRKQAEAERARLLAELGAERERLRSVIVHMPAPLALLEGPEHRFTLVNDAFRRVSGGGRDVTGLVPAAAFPELADSGLFALHDRVYAAGEPWVGRETLIRYDRDGTGVIDTWFDLRFEPVRDAAGQVTGFLNFAVDVTDQVLARREVERLLAESEGARAAAAATAARAAAVLASIADAFYLLDHGWRFTYVNDAAEPLLQTTRDRLLGRTLWEAFPDVVGSPFEGPYREAMATGRVTSAEAYFPPLGTWFDVRTYPWAGGLMVHFRDVGARKTAEAERERLLADAQAARAEAEAANRAKSEFLAVMSHELRTPLNAIGGYAQLLELGIRGPVTPEQREDLRRLQASQRHLLGLINEVLNYAKLETGTVHFDLAPVRMHDALSGAEALVAPQAQAKGLTLTVEECPPELVARADPEKLRQILVNLLSNAVKFTDRGGHIVLACADVPDGGAGARVRVTVHDTGIGIAADQQARIFDPFVQVRADLTRTAEGTGLGLAISRDLACGMSGDLTVESEPGVGSTFTLTLPADTPEAG